MNFANQIREEQNTSAPVLMNFDDQIGHTFEVQAPLKVPDGTQRPDYIFYRDETARTAHKNKIVTAEDIQHSAFAVGDAKYWERPLDQALNWSIPIITCHLHLKPEVDLRQFAHLAV